MRSGFSKWTPVSFRHGARNKLTYKFGLWKIDALACVLNCSYIVVSSFRLYVCYFLFLSLCDFEICEDLNCLCSIIIDVFNYYSMPDIDCRLFITQYVIRTKNEARERERNLKKKKEKRKATRLSPTTTTTPSRGRELDNYR